MVWQVAASSATAPRSRRCDGMLFVTSMDRVARAAPLVPAPVSVEVSR